MFRGRAKGVVNMYRERQDALLMGPPLALVLQMRSLTRVIYLWFSDIPRGARKNVY